MGVVHFGSFNGPQGFGIFQWTGSTENGALAAWASNGGRAVTVDDTGPTTYLVCQFLDFYTGDPVGSPVQTELDEGWLVKIPLDLWDPPSPPPAPVVFIDVPDGQWLSDEYGRPFDIADLQAP